MAENRLDFLKPATTNRLDFLGTATLEPTVSPISVDEPTIDPAQAFAGIPEIPLTQPIAGADPTSIGPTPGVLPDPTLAGRAAKQFANKAALETIERARPSTGIVESVSIMTGVAQDLESLPEDPTFWQGVKAIPKIWWSLVSNFYDPKSKSERAFAAKELDKLRPAVTFGVEPAGTKGERAVDIAAGIGAFVTKLLVLRRLIPPGTVLSDVVAWEILNQAEGGIPGQGAVVRGSLGAIGTIPTGSASGKIAKTIAESGLFSAATAISGGNKEDIIVSALIPIAFNGWQFVRQRQHISNYENGLRRATFQEHQARLSKGVPEPTSRALLKADQRTIQTAVQKAKQAIFHDDAFAPAREKWEVQRQKALKMVASGKPDAVKRGNAILDFMGKVPKGKPPEPLQNQIKQAKEVGRVIKAEKFRLPPEVAREARIPTRRPLAAPPATAPTAALPQAQPIQPAQPPVAEVPTEPPITPPEAVEAKPAINRVAAIERAVSAEAGNQALLRERADIKQVTPKKRTPQQIERLDEVEDELVKANADEFPDIDITEKTRNVEIKKADTQIKEHGIYEAELASLEDIPEVATAINVDSTEIGDVRARFEGRPELLRMFKLQETGGARWDEAAAEIGLNTLDEYMDAVELFVESKKPSRGGINEVALAKALNSGDPAIEMFAAKREMLKQGFNAAEVNKELQNIADGLGIPQGFVDAELISLQEITDVGKKQQILKELDRTFKKATRQKDIQSEAIKKAKLRAAKEKRPVFVVERQGRPIVVTKEPRSGTFTKITPAAPGEVEGRAEVIELGPKPKGKPRPPPQTKEQKLLITKINLEVKKKGLTQTLFSDLKIKHGGSRRLTGRTPRTVEQLQAVLKAVQRARPKVVGHKKVISLKTEKQIAELKDSLTKLGFMNDAEFQKILQIETGGKEAKFIDARKFITQKQANDVLARMHDTAQRLRVTEPIRRAVEKSPEIAAEIRKIDKLPRKAKDPSRLKSIRFFFQRMGEQANAPIYEVFLDLTLEEQQRSRNRHQATKLAEKLPDFAKIANNPKALQRVEDWIVSKSVLKGRPSTPTDITENELRLAKLVEASFKSYETLARAGKFFEFFDNRKEMPQYIKFKQGIDKAFDVYNTKGYDALIKYLDTQDWGIVSAGYSPMESVVRKVSTHRMPDIAVGKGRIRQRGITYRKQDRDILQRWYSYMRQMDQLIHIQPRIKSLVRLVNDNQQSFVNPGRINSVVSTYLDNLKHTNYEDGLIEDISRRLYSQAITVRVLADPVKVLRNFAQNVAFGEDRRDFLDPRNKKLTAEDTEYLETHVQQSSVMMSDWAFVGEDPLVFKNLTRWVQRKTLYPSSDRINRLISFHAKINRVRRAFAKDKPLAKQMKDARFSDMQKSEQQAALSILAKDGVDPMARFVAKVHTDNTHFPVEIRIIDPVEQAASLEGVMQHPCAVGR